MSENAVWAPVIASAITGILAIPITIITHHMAMKRDRDARNADLEIKRLQARAKFQSETLKELQTAMLNMITHAVVMEDKERVALDRLRCESRPLFNRILIISERVQDEQLRRLIGPLITKTALVYNPDRTDKRSDIQEADKAFQEANQHLGNILRAL